MRLKNAIVLAFSLLAVLATAPSVRSQRPPVDKANLALFADRAAYAAGDLARVAAVVEVDPGWHIQSHTPSFDYLIPTELRLELPAGWPAAEISYPEHTFWSFEFEDEPLAVYEGTLRILGALTIPATAAAETVNVEGRLRYQACDDRQCLPPAEAEATLALVVGQRGEPANTALFSASSADAGPGGAAPIGEVPSLAGVLALGLLGGLILNAMPCVLPVLSLKLLGLLKEGGKTHRTVIVGGLATSAGIVASFWALALLAIGAKAAGQLVGWGIQFQNPTFVTFLAVVVVLFCLNLWGLFEIPLPGRLARFAEGGAHEGIPGHFSTGLFATLMATPCSAPFLGTAVGFGLGQSGAVIFAVFTAIGLGMALPYLALAAAPSAVSWLPKPGEWMIRLKVVMGFLLAGAAVWLLYVLAAQVSAERLAAIEIGLLVLALFVWMAHVTRTAGTGRHLARLGVITAMAGTLWISGGGAQPVAVDVASAQAGPIAWIEFDRSRAETLSQSGRLVFVDVTADWCFTCKTNERLVLHTGEVARAFERYDVVPMQADWTNRDDEIARFLADFGRYSIPFYLLYRPGGEPHLFGELLTKGEVLRVLEQSFQPIATASTGP